MLLIDVKGAFDNESRNSFLRTMEGIGADEDLMQRTESFMSDRRIGLVIDEHQCEEMVVDPDIQQGSPVTSILFAIYLRGVFKEVEKGAESCVATSFVEDCECVGWIGPGGTAVRAASKTRNQGRGME